MLEKKTLDDAFEVIMDLNLFALKLQKKSQ